MTLTPKPNGFEVRLRYGKGRRDRFLLRLPRTPEGEATAAALEPRLEAMARKLDALAGDDARALGLLREAAAAAGDAKKFAAVGRVIERLCAEVAGLPPQPAASGTLSTFRDVAEAWCSGKLTELYPDHKLLPDKSQKGREDDRKMVRVFYPALGDKPISELTLEDIDAARRLLPRSMHPNTRRNHALRLRTVLRLAVSPLRLVEKVPEVEIPRRKASNLFGFLYPQEEALLLGCTAIPLVYRMLYGYLARNGCRIGETLRLTWDHVDLETGDIHIDKAWTKTKRARRWVLDRDVFEAFEGFHREQGEPAGKAFVFPGRSGKLSQDTLLSRLHSDLRLAGVTRKSILEGGDGVDALRVHDLRASFVTLSLRAGRDLKWIMTRTGHETLGVLSVYDRLIQDANEHRLPAWFVPMAEALPELRRWAKGGPRVGQGAKSAKEMPSSVRSGWTAEPGENEPNPREKAPSLSPETSLQPTSGPASFKGVGQTGPGEGGPTPEPVATAPEPSDPVERALAFAVEEATKDKRWDVVLTCTRELEQRRLARVPSNVTSLDSRRKPKGEGK